MNIKIGVSNRHVHLTEEDYITLFGNDHIEKNNDLVQTGEFSSTSFVELQTEKDCIKKVRVLGPFRNYTQVEVSKTDCYKLGINPPVAASGDLEDASVVTIVGPSGTITKKCAIIANRHIHINSNLRKEYGLENISKVQVKVGNTKKAILDDVYIKESEKGVFELHLDTDDANGCLLKSGDEAELII